jgi:hypothetical protein
MAIEYKFVSRSYLTYVIVAVAAVVGIVITQGHVIPMDVRPMMVTMITVEVILLPMLQQRQSNKVRYRREQ